MPEAPGRSPRLDPRAWPVPLLVLIILAFADGLFVFGHTRFAQALGLEALGSTAPSCLASWAGANLLLLCLAVLRRRSRLGALGKEAQARLEPWTTRIASWTALGRDPRRSWLPVAAALAFLGWTYLFGNAHEPGLNGDESSLLNVPYRIVEYGEVRYPAWLDSAFGNDRLRRFPPLSSFWLRTGFHALFGVSAAGARTCSALLVLSGVLIGAACLRRLAGVGPVGLAAYLCSVGLATPVIAAARSFRNEQEVFFLGIVGSVLLPMLLRPGRPLVSIGSWAASGVAIGVAAASHPWGVCYALVVGGSLLVLRRGWAERDGLGATTRTGAFVAGLGVGALPTVLGQLLDWEQARAYMAWQQQQYAIREVEGVRWLALQAPWGSLRCVLGDGMAARLNSLDLAAFAQHALGEFHLGIAWFGSPLRIVFYLALVVVTVRVATALIRRERFSDPLHPVCLGLALVFPAFFALYPPNINYGLYAGFHVPLALCLTLWSSPIAASRWRSVAVAGLHLLACALGLAYAVGYDLRVIRSVASRERETLSLDQQLGALSAAGARAGFLGGTGGSVYTSLESWIAAGRDQRSLLEPVVYDLADVPEDHGGAVFGLQNLDVFMFLSGGGIGRGVPLSERGRRLSALLRPLALREVVLAEVGVQSFSTYVYARRTQPELDVSIIRRDGTHGLLRTSTIPADERGVDLPAGRYLLLARMGTVEERPAIPGGPANAMELLSSIGPLVELRVGEAPQVFAGFRLLNSIVPIPVAFEVPAGGARVSWCPASRATFAEQQLLRLEGW